MKKIREFLKDFLSKPHQIFLILSLIGGVGSAFLVPQLSVNDETAHLLRSYTLSTGQFSQQKCEIPIEILEANQNAHSGNYKASKKALSGAKEISSCGSAVNYNPILHLPQSLGFILTKPLNPPLGSIILVSRIFNAIAYTLIIFFTLKYVRVGRWAFAAIALIPISLHSAGSLSGDSMNNAIAISFLAFLFDTILVKKTLTNKRLLVITALSILLLTTKPSNIPLLGLLFLLPKNLFKRLPGPKNIFIRKLFYTLIISVAALIPCIIWKVITSSSPGAEPSSNLGIIDNSNLLTMLASFAKVLYNTYISPFVGYTNFVLNGIMNAFSSFRYSLPNIFILLEWIVLALFILDKKDTAKTSLKKIRILSLTSMIILAIIVTGVSYFMYVHWAMRLGTTTLHAEGVQGRYFTPLLGLFIPMGAWLSRHINVNFKNPYINGIVLIGVYGFTIIYYLYQTRAFAYIIGA